MSDKPYVNFYTSDFLAGTGGMTAACKGVYITLLCQMYEAEAPLGQSWDALARRCGATLPAFKKAIETLVEDGKIVVTGDGIWSPKCEKHITLRRERQSSAKAAAKTRWEKSKQKQGKADAGAANPQCQPDPEPEEEDKSSSQEADFYLKYLDAHPCPVETKNGEENFAALVRSGVDPETIIAAAAAYADKAKMFSNQSFVQQSDNFLDPERGKWKAHIPKQIKAPTAYERRAVAEKFMQSPIPAVREQGKKMMQAIQ